MYNLYSGITGSINSNSESIYMSLNRLLGRITKNAWGSSDVTAWNIRAKSRGGMRERSSLSAFCSFTEHPHASTPLRFSLNDVGMLLHL